jgi:paired small multidrug resistance pump
MAWVTLILAGFCEMFGIAMINKFHRHYKLLTLILLILGFGVSFLLLSYSMRTLPMGTTYAIWTGIGASGGSILGILLYGESKNWQRIGCIFLVLGAAIGLKLIS